MGCVVGGVVGDAALDGVPRWKAARHRLLDCYSLGADERRSGLAAPHSYPEIMPDVKCQTVGFYLSVSLI